MVAELAVGFHGVAALVAAALGLHLAFGWRGGQAGGLLLGLMGATFLWATAGALGAATGNPRVEALGGVFDVARQGFGVWLVVLILGGGRRVRGLSVCAALVCALVTVFVVARAIWLSAFVERLHALAALALSVVGLTALEQLWRNLSQSERWGVKPLAVALAGGFGFDLYAHAEAALFGGVSEDVAPLRAAVAVIGLVFLWLFAARHRPANVAVTVSRQLVFHTTALAACGAYLLLMSAAGFYVRDFGGRWGPALQVMLVFAGLLLLSLLATSGALRARLRWLLARHCFKLRYDYREVWLGLTRSLAKAQGASDVAARALAELCALVECSGGVLWWADDEGRLVPRACLAVAQPAPIALPPDAAPASLVDEVVDVAGEPLPAWLDAVRQVAGGFLLVPLLVRGVLKGLVLLTRPRVGVVVDWEVRDVLKTAATQVAGDLAHWQALEALVDARRFEATSRMGTFVLHELKNRASELSLLLANAARHGDKPEFRDDMLLTVEHAATRLRGLIEMVREGGRAAASEAVCVGSVLEKIAAERSGCRPSLNLSLRAEARVRADATRLARVLGHLAQNAIDATDARGRVWVNLDRTASCAVIEFHDTGVGMSEHFMRERLFKPFQTTKALGMGIGVYECQQYIRELGGAIEVQSREGVGTCMRVSIPLAQSLGGARVAA